MPVGLVELGEDAFSDCGSLQQETLTIPRTVRKIGDQCFIWCKSLTLVVFKHQLPTDTIVLQPSVFSNCAELRAVTLPPTLSKIPTCCFGGCRSLTNVPIPTAVRVINRGAFKYCSALRRVDLSENITAIHREAYISCTLLVTVTIRSTTVQFLGHVFHMCRALTTINIYPWVIRQERHKPTWKEHKLCTVPSVFARFRCRGQGEMLLL